jgi:hypothetical protein
MVQKIIFWPYDIYVFLTMLKVNKFKQKKVVTILILKDDAKSKMLFFLSQGNL